MLIISNIHSASYANVNSRIIDFVVDGTYEGEAFTSSIFTYPSRLQSVANATCAEWLETNTPDPVFKPPEVLAEEIRQDRNSRLRESDYTQLRDMNLSNDAEWVIYRQALRDVPQQEGFPTTITWPTEPS